MSFTIHKAFGRQEFERNLCGSRGLNKVYLNDDGC